MALTLAGCMSVPDASSRIGSRAFEKRVEHAERTRVTSLSGISCPDSSPAAGGVDEWNSTFAQLQPGVWRSGDVGVTAALSDGRVAWFFGDTTRAPSVHPRIVANSMLLSRGRCFEEVRVKGSGPLIPSTSRNEACWPNSAMALPEKKRDLLIVACSRIRRGGAEKPGAALYDFAYRGMSLAIFSVRPRQAPTLVSVENVVPDSPDQSRINWGSAMVGDHGWVYIYGSQQPKGSSGKAAYVARCRVSQITGTASWEYWNGHSFSDDPEDARPFLAASEGVSQTFSVVPWRGQFLLVSKQGGEFGANVGVWSAATPAGPWRGIKAVPEPYSQGNGVVAYQPLAHPEIPTKDGSLLVSMSRNTEHVNDLLADPRKGRPLFLEVPLP